MMAMMMLRALSIPRTIQFDIEDPEASFVVEFVMYCTLFHCPGEHDQDTKECEKGDGHFISK